jgi:Zn-dependent protease with chaperone function
MKRAIVLILAASALSCATARSYVTGQPTFNRFSLEEEIDLGTRQATLMIAGAEALHLTIDPDRPSTKTARAIVARILAVPENRARMPPLPFELHVIGDLTQNAYTMPGGQILVMSGMFDGGMVRDEDEAAAVIGHELGHAAARHATERQSIESLRDALAPLGTFFGPRMVELVAKENPKVLIEKLGKSVSEFDQSQELEADLIGLELMTRAGYDPEKASHVWRRLAQFEGPAPAAPSSPEQIETHPRPTLRVEQLDLHLPVARYIRERLVSAPIEDPPRTGWSYPLGAATPTVSRSLPGEGPLVLGAHVRSRYFHPPAKLLDLRARIWIEPGGLAPRGAFAILAARDLYEDQVRFSAMLMIEPDAPRSERLPAVHAAVLARDAALSGPRVEMRVALPRLPAGRYKARVRAVMGALWVEREEPFRLE